MLNYFSRNYTTIFTGMIFEKLEKTTHPDNIDKITRFYMFKKAAFWATSEFENGIIPTYEKYSQKVS